MTFHEGSSLNRHGKPISTTVLQRTLVKSHFLRRLIVAKKWVFAMASRFVSASPVTKTVFKPLRKPFHMGFQPMHGQSVRSEPKTSNLPFSLFSELPPTSSAPFFNLFGRFLRREHRESRQWGRTPIASGSLQNGDQIGCLCNTRFLIVLVNRNRRFRFQ